MYVDRSVEKRIKKLSGQYPVVMICGARQTGKSTVMNHVKEETRRYISLDDLNVRRLAVEDPALFVQKYKPPIIIDEFQYAPDILSYIKLEIDRRNLNGEDSSGMYWLSGSQQFKMMKNVSESLAGRVAIIDLSSLSSEEIDGVQKGLFVPKIEYMEKRMDNSKILDITDIYKRIFKGGMPKLIATEIDRSEYYSNYVRTYLERDIRDLAQVGNITSFHNYLVYLSARIGQELNYVDASRAIGVSSPTIKSWTSILEASGIIFLLRPYANSMTKRLVKTSKLYFMDTGLCSYLAKWPSVDTLENGAMDGAYLENYVVSEIVKSYYNYGKEINFYYYRDFDQKEIDLVFEEADTLIPVEIKKNVYPEHADKNFNVLKRFNLKVSEGIVLSMIEEITPLNRNTYLIPISIL